MRIFKNGADGVYDWLKKAASVIGCEGGFNPTSYYIYIFDDVPKTIATIGQDITNTKLVCSIDCVDHIPVKDEKQESGEELMYGGIDVCAGETKRLDGSIFGGKDGMVIAMDNFLKKDNRYFIYSFFDQRNSRIEYYVIIACDNCIAFTTIWHTTSANITTERIRVLAPDNDTARKASDYLIQNCDLIIPPDARKCRIGVAYKSYGEVGINNYELVPTDAHIDTNYNDDLPYDKIIEILKKDESALMLFYGTPGTGKSTLIKHIISHTDDVNFVYFDSDLLLSIGNAALLNFALDHKNTVFIMEDCEKILVDRKNDNPIMNTLLNITDGILGDCMKLKIICTFNTNLDEVDKALLRKGRLKLKYEFKPLALEKAKVLLPSATQPMTLADIYYSDEENDFSKEPQKKTIGFGTTH